jgi:integration host factor subunit beta
VAGDAHDYRVARARFGGLCDQRVPVIVPPVPMGARKKPQVGLRGTKEHCDTLFRDATGVRQMTRADLTEEVCQATEMPRKESDGVVCAIFDGIVRALRVGDKVEIRGFGSFHTRQRQARIGRNPRTGARVKVPPKRIPFFKPSKELRELVDSLTVNA